MPLQINKELKLSTNSKKNIEGVHPDLISVIDRALEISKVDFGIPSDGGLRNEKQQNELFKKGLSQLDGYDKKSNHQTGKAFDIFAYVDGKATWEILYISQVACAILQAASEMGVKIQWGGHWTKFIDTPHFEIKRG